MIEDLRKVAQPSFAKTNFVGFTESTTQAVVKMLFNDKCESVETLTGQGYVIFDQTPFYAMGGDKQVTKEQWRSKAKLSQFLTFEKIWLRNISSMPLILIVRCKWVTK
jgi:alanyl-tRNA synthetase